MNKILIIAQAPPLKTQARPMDSTLFETWLKDAGFEFAKLEDVFEFEAVYDKFPGKTAYGAHKAPTKAQMKEHWADGLGQKFYSARRIWIMGNVAFKYIWENHPMEWDTKNIISTLHPSRRNLHAYRQNKNQIIQDIQSLLR